METTITATELSRRLSDVLNRVKYRGERFVVQRNGETIATISPANERPTVTLREVIARIGDLPLPGEGFADELELKTDRRADAGEEAENSASSDPATDRLRQEIEPVSIHDRPASR